MPDGRMAALRPGLAPRAGGGKSGLHGGTVPGNARRGRPQGKCHRKHTAEPAVLSLDGTAWAARVKWCGKSAPRRRQRRRQGKPHREQDQVGAAGGVGLPAPPGGPLAPPLGSVARGVRRRTSQMNGHPRPFSGAGQNPAYRPSGTFIQYPARRLHFVLAPTAASTTNTGFSSFVTLSSDLGRAALAAPCASASLSCRANRT